MSDHPSPPVCHKIILLSLVSHSVVSHSLPLCDPMDCSSPGFRVLHHLPELAQTHVRRVGGAIQRLTRCRPLLLLPSVFPSIRVFSKQSVLRIRWPKDWLFSFSISPSSEYSGSISLSFMNNKLMNFEYRQSLLCINETVDFQTG